MSRGSYISGIEKFLSHDPLAEKIFIVPSFTIGHQIGEAMARNGHPWVNMRFTTLPSLAAQTAGPAMAAERKSLLSSTASRTLIHRILHDLRSEKRLLYFGGLELRPGLITAFYRSIQEIRNAGITSRDLDASFFVNQAKGREVALVLKRYEFSLQDGCFYDTSELLRSAIEIARGDRKNQDRRYFCLDSQVLSFLEKAFLDALAGENLHFIQRGDVQGLPRPRLYQKVPSTRGEPSGPITDLGRTPWLFSLTKAPPPENDGTLTMFHALGENSECREVFRRLSKAEIPLDDVEILCPSGSGYAVQFSGLAGEVDVSLTLGDGLPAAFTNPGKVYQGVVEWMAGGFAAEDLCDMLGAGLIRLPESGSGPTPSGMEIIRILRRAKIGWGRERYGARLESLEREAGEKAEKARNAGDDSAWARLNSQADSIRFIRTWIETLLRGLPPWQTEEDLEWGEVCTSLSKFLKKHAVIRDEKEGKVLGLLTAALDDIGSARPPAAHREDVLEWLQSILFSCRVGRSGPSPGSIHVSSIENGGFSGRSHTFIVGMDQSAVPGSRLPDPILLDEERERISPNLIRTTDRLREGLYALTALLSSLRGQVALSYSSYDTLGERSNFPSSFLLQLHRLLEGKPELDYSSLLQFLGEPAGFIPDFALDMRDWWLDRIAAGGRFREALRAVKENFPHISLGDEARAFRLSETAGTYDGLVPIPPELIHPCVNPDLQMSASRLETLAACPYRYFLRYILGIEPPDETVRERSAWLDPMQRGTLLHEIFCEFLASLREKGELVDPARHAAEIDETAGRIIARFKEEIPAPSEAVAERDTAEIFETLKIFLRMERLREEAVEPVLFEVRFGIRGEGEGMDESVVVELPGGAAFRLGGRIDRIDRMRNGEYRVIDYKTGSPGIYEKIKCFGRGRYLQAALYALAAEEILRRRGVDESAQVRLSGYAFPTRRGDGREILFENIDRTKLRNLLDDLLSILEHGIFLVHPDAGCRFCDFAPLCGPDAAERSKVKKSSNENVYAVLERLKEYE